MHRSSGEHQGLTEQLNRGLLRDLLATIIAVTTVIRMVLTVISTILTAIGLVLDILFRIGPRKARASLQAVTASSGVSEARGAGWK